MTLQFKHMGILAAQLHQLVVRVAFHDLAVFQVNDTVTEASGRETVGNIYRSLIGGQLVILQVKLICNLLLHRS